MSATLLYRIASALLVLFAVGHTIGFLRFRPPTPEGAAVYEAMRNVHFQVGGTSFSYGGFYIGFGCSSRSTCCLRSYLAWYLGSLAATNAQPIGTLRWAFFATQLAVVALSWIYFSAAPVVFAALVAVCVGLAAWLIK